MFLQANVDDSIGDDGTFVLAGYIASNETWDAFIPRWEALVETDGVWNKTARRKHFKMKQMTYPDRMVSVEKFYRLIEEHKLIALACVFNINDFKRAFTRIAIPGVRLQWLGISNKYVFAYKWLLDMLHHHKERWTGGIPLDQKVDFVFDKQREAQAFLDAWDAYIEGRPRDVLARYGERPDPRSDLDWLPLQAADFWAWWVRKWAMNGGDIKQAMTCPSFGPFKEEATDLFKIGMRLSEDQIADALFQMARAENGRGRT